MVKKIIKKAGIFLVGFIVLLIIIGKIGQQNNQNILAVKIPNGQEKINIPALIGQNYAFAEKTLGKPTNEFKATGQQIKLGIANSADWQRQGVTLQTDYKTIQEPLKYFFLSSDQVGYSAEQLIEIGQLSSSDSAYRILPQKKAKGTGITGIHICAAGYTSEFCP